MGTCGTWCSRANELRAYRSFSGTACSTAVPRLSHANLERIEQLVEKPDHMPHKCQQWLPFVMSALTYCGLGHSSARCQILTPADLFPAVGASYHQFPLINEVPWDTLQGQNATWDYSWITLDDLGYTYSAIPINDAPAIASYPGTDRVVRLTLDVNSDYVIDHYYDEQADRLVELGSVWPDDLSYVYDMPETVYGLPMQLGDTLHGDYCLFGYAGSCSPFHFCGENLVTFDAIGTLILPFGTYTNVKHVTRWRSSFETTGPATDSTYSVEQEWFAPGIPYPLLDLSIYIDGVGQFWPSGRVMDLPSITGVCEVAEGMTFGAHPNPATDIITIERASTSLAMIEVRALDGRIVQGTYFPEGSLGLTLSLEGLADGIYMIRLVGEGSNTAQRLVKRSR